jgi:hypothetical protein
MARLFPPAVPAGTARPLPEWSEIARELKRKGVTLLLLWLEYKAAHPDGYQYTQFVEARIVCLARLIRCAIVASGTKNARRSPLWSGHPRRGA